MAVASRRADGGKWRASKQRRDGQDALRMWTASISAAGKKKAWEKALQLLFEGQQRRLGPNVIACNAAISACEKAARWPQAIALLQPDSEIQGWNGAISACSKAGAWSMALLLLSALEKLPARRDAVHFGLRIACEAPRSWQKAITSLVAMQEAALEPNVRNFSALLRGCKEATAWESGLELLQQMFAKGPAPDVLAVNTVIASNPPWVIALALLEQMPRRTLTPSTSSVNAVIQSCGLAGEWPVVLSFMSQLRHGERVNMDDVTYVNAFTAYGRSKRRDLVSELLQDLRHPSSQPSVSAFSAAVAAAHWAEALQLLEEIASRQLRPQRQDLNAVIGNAAEDAWTASFQLFCEMPWRLAASPNVISLTTLLQASRGTSAWDVSLDLLWRSNIEPNVMSVAEMAQCLTSSTWRLSVQLLADANAQRLADEVVQSCCLRPITSDAWQRCAAVMMRRDLASEVELVCLSKASNAGEWAVALSTAVGKSYSIRTLGERLAGGPWQQLLQLDVAVAHVAHEDSAEWQQSFAFFQALVARSAEPSMAGATSWQHALRMREVTDMSGAMKLILQALAERGRFQDLQEVLQEELSKLPEPAVPRAWSAGLYKAFGQFCRGQHWNDASKLLRCLSTAALEPELLSQNLLLGAWQKSPRLWPKVLNALDVLPRQGYVPDIFSYGSVLATASTWQRSCNHLRCLFQQQLRLSAVALSALVTCAQRAFHWRLALQFCSTFSGELTTIACSSAVGACENLGAWRRAVELLRRSSSLQLRRDLVLTNAAAGTRAGSGWQRSLEMLGPELDRAGKVGTMGAV